MSSEFYILEGRTPKPAASLEEWAMWMGTSEQCRRVAQDRVGDVVVSTVFLGINHNFCGGAPLIFETIIFGGPHDEYQMRCSTWEQAEAMHAAALTIARGDRTVIPMRRK